MTEPYDLRSNIKGKPGSQGTLFQVKDKGLLNPQQRWPHGYTPERLNEVRSATKSLSIRPPESFDNESSDREVNNAAYGNRDRVHKAIARSTVPVEHLAGLKQIHGDPDEDDQGTYWPARKEIGVDMTGIQHPEGYREVTPRREAEKTLIHEIGHHVHNDGTTSRGSWEASQAITRVGEKHAWGDKSPYREHLNRSDILMGEDKVQAGVHEALADDYYVEHYRGPGRKGERATQGRYEGNFNADERERVYPGYNDVRPPVDKLAHLGPQFKQESLF